MHVPTACIRKNKVKKVSEVLGIFLGLIPSKKLFAKVTLKPWLKNGISKSNT